MKRKTIKTYNVTYEIYYGSGDLKNTTINGCGYCEVMEKFYNTNDGVIISIDMK